MGALAIAFFIVVALWVGGDGESTPRLSACEQGYADLVAEHPEAKYQTSQSRYVQDCKDLAEFTRSYK